MIEDKVDIWIWGVKEKVEIIDKGWHYNFSIGLSEISLNHWLAVDKEGNFVMVYGGDSGMWFVCDNFK